MGCARHNLSLSLFLSVSLSLFLYFSISLSLSPFLFLSFSLSLFLSFSQEAPMGCVPPQRGKWGRGKPSGSRQTGHCNRCRLAQISTKYDPTVTAYDTFDPGHRKEEKYGRHLRHETPYKRTRTKKASARQLRHGTWDL